MVYKFTVATVLPATPQAVYDAWLDSKAHGAMTGAKATASPEVGARYTATDDYIWGTNLELVPGEKIVQSWRSTDFASGDQDSLITVMLKAVPEGTELTLHHSDIPDSQADTGYVEGWRDYYFTPMLAYFTKAAKKAAAMMMPKSALAKKGAAKKPKAAAKAKPKAAARAKPRTAAKAKPKAAAKAKPKAAATAKPKAAAKAKPKAAAKGKRRVAKAGTRK